LNQQAGTERVADLGMVEALHSQSGSGPAEELGKKVDIHHSSKAVVHCNHHMRAGRRMRWEEAETWMLQA
jgi:hypothetical protein